MTNELKIRLKWMKKLLVNINFWEFLSHIALHALNVDHTTIIDAFFGIIIVHHVSFGNSVAVRKKKCYYCCHGCSLTTHKRQKSRLALATTIDLTHDFKVRGSKCNTSFSFFHDDRLLLFYFSLTAFCCRDAIDSHACAHSFFFLCLFLSTFVLLFIWF